MGLFRRNKTEKRSMTFKDKELLLQALGIETDGMSQDKIKEATYYTCLRILADTVSKLPLKIYLETNNGIQKATDHYLYSMLKLRPNKNMSSSDFWKCVDTQRNDHGHSVVYINTLPNGKVEGLYPLDMNFVQIIVDDEGIIDENGKVYYVYNTGKRELIFQSDEVLHFKGMTRDGIHGLSVREYLKTTLENLQYGSDYVNRYFKGGLTAKGLLQYTSDIEDNGVENMKKRFQNMANGMKNVGSILPVPVGFTFTTINSTMADAQFIELNQFSVKQIAAAFGIKMHQLNDLTDATYSNISEQMEEFYRDTLQSILTMYEQELAYKLFNKAELKKNYFFRFNVDSILRTDIKSRFEAYKVAIDGGFMKPQEARDKEDWSYVEEADQLIVNGTYVPLKKVGMHSENYQEQQPTNEPKESNEGGETVDEQGNSNTNNAD
ncbi:phage portal protein [Priestia aryabhattai]|uniref:phage portal protein n=1 Tax=Priestia aryabhattai TaxID=412384 RepID=UPI0027E47C94|nr:phage portal protein [Priestia aryabhattai]